MRDKFKLNKRRWFIGAVLSGVALVMIGTFVLVVVIVSYGQRGSRSPR